MVLQTALLDRLPFPGGSAPDLVLVLVVTLALASGPMPGLLIGFGAGLALDMAPPATNLLGLSALVFCLVGYGCGRLRGPLERSAWLPLAVVALGVTAGEALYALIGLMFGDPDISWQSIRLVLPVAVVYDILLCPFVVYAVVRFGGYGGWATAGAREPGLLAGRDLAGAGLLGGVAAAGATAAGAAVRDTRSGREPRLRAAAGRQADGWIGGHPSGPGQPPGPWVSGRRPLHLRARSGVAGSAAAAGTGQGRQPGPPGTGRTVRLRLGAPRRGDGVLGGSLRALVGGGRRSACRAGPAGPAGRPGCGGPPSAGPPATGPAWQATAPGVACRARCRPGCGPGPSAAGPRPWPGRAVGDWDGPPGCACAAAGGTGCWVVACSAARHRWGRGAGGGMPGGRGMSGATFTARRAPGAPGPLRSGRGQGAVPRFRATGRGLSRLVGRVPRRRGSLPGGGRGGLGGRRGLGSGRRTGLGRWGRWAGGAGAALRSGG